MDSSQVCVFEQRNKICLCSFLQCHYRGRLEAKISLYQVSITPGPSRDQTIAYLEILSNLANKSLKRQLSDQELGRLLVSPYFTESNGSRAESVWFLDTTSSSLISHSSQFCMMHNRSTYRGGLSGSFSSELFAGRLT